MTSLTELKQKISHAQAAKARAEVMRDQVETELGATRARLKEDFGVETPDEARRIIGELTAQRDAAIERAMAKLEESE
jgi:hypothetical protein